MWSEIYIISPHIFRLVDSDSDEASSGLKSENCSHFILHVTPLSWYNQKTVVSIHVMISAHSWCLPKSALTHLLLLP